MKTLLLKNIKHIHKQAGENLSILIRNGVIETIAPFEEIDRTFGMAPMEPPDVLDCSKWIAIPGFVDSHTHLLFAGSREAEFYLRASGEDYLSVMKKGGGLYHTVDAFTSNPANMLFLPDRGRIEKGARADVLLFALDNIGQIPYFGTVCQIKHVIKNGKRFEPVKTHEN
jgi:imidazolonepropionase-like amidohydrolase